MLLAKWLAGQPNLLVLHEPTQAVDVGARHGLIDAPVFYGGVLVVAVTISTLLRRRST